MINKKGSNLQIWIEVVLFSILVLFILGFIGSDMNQRYNRSENLTLGLNMNSQFDSLKNLSSSATNDSTSGQASLTDFGVFKLLSTPAMIMQVTSILWNFLNGNFIRVVVNGMQLGEIGFYLGVILQILYILTILFIIIKLVLRIPI